MRGALTWHCDLTGAPRKKLLRALADHCGSTIDRARLLFLCGCVALPRLRVLLLRR